MTDVIGDAAMNLIGLILIAALSGGIVAVSLRLRASSSTDWMWMEGSRLHDEDRHSRAHQSEGPSKGRFRARFAPGVSRFFMIV
jgi:hypothetical protein